MRLGLGLGEQHAVEAVLLVERAQVLRDEGPRVFEETRHRPRAARKEDAAVDVGHRREVGP